MSDSSEKTANTYQIAAALLLVLCAIAAVLVLMNRDSSPARDALSGLEGTYEVEAFVVLVNANYDRDVDADDLIQIETSLIDFTTGDAEVAPVDVGATASGSVVQGTAYIDQRYQPGGAYTPPGEGRDLKLTATQRPGIFVDGPMVLALHDLILRSDALLGDESDRPDTPYRVIEVPQSSVDAVEQSVLAADSTGTAALALEGIAQGRSWVSFAGEVFVKMAGDAVTEIQWQVELVSDDTTTDATLVFRLSPSTDSPAPVVPEESIQYKDLDFEAPEPTEPTAEEIEEYIRQQQAEAGFDPDALAAGEEVVSDENGNPAEADSFPEEAPGEGPEEVNPEDNGDPSTESDESAAEEE